MLDFCLYPLGFIYTISVTLSTPKAKTEHNGKNCQGSQCMTYKISGAAEMILGTNTNVWVLKPSMRRWRGVRDWLTSGVPRACSPANSSMLRPPIWVGSKQVKNTWITNLSVWSMHNPQRAKKTIQKDRNRTEPHVTLMEIFQNSLHQINWHIYT